MILQRTAWWSVVVLTGVLGATSVRGPLNPSLLAGVVAFLLTSLVVAFALAGRLRGRTRRARASGTSATATAEALRREWVESTTQLAACRDQGERLAQVRARADVLDELAASCDGRLPDYVFDSLTDRTG
jgi:hypothetical protein